MEHAAGAGRRLRARVAGSRAVSMETVARLGEQYAGGCLRQYIGALIRENTPTTVERSVPDFDLVHNFQPVFVRPLLADRYQPALQREVP